MNAEQQLEAITENNEDVETEDDSFLQSMKQFSKNPVNLNTAGLTTLQELTLLSPLQIHNIISYRSLLGHFISIYELQAVPGLDLALLERLKPFITVNMAQHVAASIAARFKAGTSTLLVRAGQIMEKQKGFKIEPGDSTNYYPGSQIKLYARYKYQYRNLLQFGIVGEKDAGECFFKGAQKNGFDFYSAHLFARNIGIIQSLALGDFTINLGQGLTQWQSLAFKKSADIPNIKRQLAVLRPYNSAGETNFHRGIGITLAKNKLEGTFFISFRSIDANVEQDTVSNSAFITSLQTSGLHRTKSETADKAAQRQLAMGANLAYHHNSFHAGINTMQYEFKLPVKKSADPYNRYAISGKSFGNYSADYSYTFRNIHLFGEAAFTRSFDKAYVQGLIISADSKIDVSLLYRNISKSYQSLYSNAFTENTFPNNEKGMYAGISIRPNGYWRMDAYADFYTFPWLKYLVDAPSAGSDYLVQATYKRGKQLEMYLRYRTETKSKNQLPALSVISPVLPFTRQSVRSHFSYKLNNAITVRNRLEMVWVNKRRDGAQNGYLGYVDCIVHPLMKKYAGSVRIQYFETDGYDSRLYAYENDVLYSFSIPVFYDKGYRYYVNLNYDVHKKISVWLRWAQTIFKGKDSIGTGLDEITGNKRTEVKIQAMYQF